MKVLVECYHDWALVHALGVQRENLLHAGGKGNVLAKLSECGGTAVGLVDADTGKPHSNPREMAQYEPQKEAHGLRLLRRQGQPDKALVVIEPMLEE